MKPRFATPRANNLRRDRSGLAAVEYALMAPIWVTLILMMVDFGQAFYLKLKLATALSVAAQYAFLNAQVVQPATVPSFLTNVSTIVQIGADLATAPTVTALFNNAADASNAANYYCISGYSPVTYTSTGTTSASCGSSVMSGKFVSISIVGSVATFFVGDPIFGSSISVLDSVVVRFQ